MKEFFTKYQIIIICITALMFIFFLLYALTKFSSCKEISCNKNDTTYNELSTEYLKLDSSNKAKDKEIERLIVIIKDSIKNTVIQEQVIKYIKVYVDSNIVRQTGNQDKQDILRRFAKFYLNNPKLEIYNYDSSVQKQMNLTFNDYDYQKSDNKILNKRCEFLTTESSLWQSRYEVSQSNYDNCQNELQRILDVPKVTNKIESDLQFKLAGYLHYQNEFKRYNELNKARVFISAETGIKYKRVPVFFHWDSKEVNKFEIKTGIEF